MIGLRLCGALVLALLVVPAPPPQLSAVWHADGLHVAWTSAIPVCLAVENAQPALLPETCDPAVVAWTLSAGGVDAAYAVRLDTTLHLIANDGQPRVLASLRAPPRYQRWLPVIGR